MAAPEKIGEVLRDLVGIYRETYRQAMLSELPDMTFRQFVYLDAIVRMHSPTYGEVAARFRVTKPAVTAIVNKLIGLGYLERLQSREDRRIHHLVVSEKAKAILAIENATAMGWVAAMKDCLTEEEQDRFVAIAGKIIAGMKTKKAIVF